MTKLGICARTIFLLVILPFLLKVFRLSQILGMLDNRKKSRTEVGELEAVNTANSIIDFDVFGFKVFFPNCLKRSLVIFHILKKMSNNVKFVWSVKKQGANLSAHSWVEKNGVPVYRESVNIEEYHKIFLY